MARVQTSFLWVLATATFALAAPPVVELPEIVVPQPMPPPATTATLTVSADTLFVVQSKEKVTITTSPAGLVKVVQEVSPFTVKAIFADGNGKFQRKTFSQPFVYTVEPVKSGDCELLVIPEKVTGEADIVRRSLRVDAGEGPRPPPVPPDPPVPVVVQGTWAIMIVNETTPDPKAVLVTDGPTARSLKLAGKCRLYGTVSDAEKIAMKKYDKAMATAKVTPNCVLILDDGGNVTTAFALPATDADLAAKLKGVLK